MKPAVGMMVLYRLSEDDRPFLITAVHSELCVSGKVFVKAEGPFERWPYVEQRSVLLGVTRLTWRFPND